MPDTVNLTEERKLRGLPWAVASGALVSIFCVWTFSGSVFLLFLDQLGLPKAQIGAMLSLFPLAGIVALGVAPYVSRLGRKRVFISLYGARKLVMATLLLLPLVQAQCGRGAAVGFVVGVIILFALCRAVAETGYYPWSQEFIPNRVRGQFGAWNSVVATLAMCAALWVAGRVIGHGTGLDRFLWLIGSGAVIGLAGVLFMFAVPGGAPMRDSGSQRTHLAEMRRALNDANFRAYLGGLGFVTLGTLLLTSFLPLFLKEKGGLAPGLVVSLDMATLAGAILSSFAWGLIADRHGSRPALMLSLGLATTIPVLWLLLPRHSAGLVWAAGTLYLLNGVATAGISIATGRLLFTSVIPVEKNTAYGALYYAWAGLTAGIAPFLAGGCLSLLTGFEVRLGPVLLDGYGLVFALSLLVLAPGIVLYRRVKPDNRFLTRDVMRGFTAGLRERLLPNAWLAWFR